jgi:tetrahydromethanopterin S-methyltransferase subunit G
MAEPAGIEQRLTSLESRVEVVAADASAARHLAAAHDRDLADLGVKVDANRRAINALGIQTAGRFDRVEQRLDNLENKVDTGFAMTDAGFAEVRGELDQTAAGHEQIVGLLNHVIARVDRE